MKDVEDIRSGQAEFLLRLDSLQEQAARIEDTYAPRDKWLEKDYILRTMIESFEQQLKVVR